MKNYVAIATTAHKHFTKPRLNWSIFLWTEKFVFVGLNKSLTFLSPQPNHNVNTAAYSSQRQTYCIASSSWTQGVLRQRTYIPVMAQLHRSVGWIGYWIVELWRPNWSNLGCFIHLHCHGCNALCSLHFPLESHQDPQQGVCSLWWSSWSYCIMHLFTSCSRCQLLA